MFEGGTPLVHARRLGEKLGLSNLYLKDETRNPTCSFKDRSISVGASKAVELKKKDVITASSGNAASSLAAYSATLGLNCYAFVPENITNGKLAQLIFFGAKVFRIRQTEDGVDPTTQMMLSVVEELGFYPCPSFGSFNPYQVEGPKAIYYEIAEQMEWSPPTLIPSRRARVACSREYGKG